MVLTETEVLNPRAIYLQLNALYRIVLATCVVSVSTACWRLPELDPSTPLAMGRAEFADSNYVAAIELFRVWVNDHPDDAGTWVMMGAAFEEVQMADSARSAYLRASGLRLPRGVRRDLDNRITMLERSAREMRARVAAEQEARLASAAPEPNTVAVFPLRYIGSREDRRPLERGLAHIFVSDLVRLDVMKVLERASVDLLVQEISLANTGWVDRRNGARSGRMLRAERVLQGSIVDVPGSERIHLVGALIETETLEYAGEGRVNDRPLEEIFDMERDVLFQILGQIGIVLTDVERELLAARPTANMQAFLAFSRGLIEEDRGNLVGAASEYREAVSLDPGFDDAAVRAEEVEGEIAAQNTRGAELAQVMTAVATDMGFLASQLGGVMPSGVGESGYGQGPPQERNPGSDVGGGDRLAKSGAVLIRIRRP